MNVIRKRTIATVAVITAASALATASAAQAAPDTNAPGTTSAADAGTALAPDTVRSAKVAASPKFADPAFARFDLTTAQTPRYFLYATGKGFPVISSASAVGGYGAPTSSMTAHPKWVSRSRSDLWAPHVTRRPRGDLPGDFTYTMLFNGRRTSDEKHCIGVATSQSPTGPFKPRKEPLLCPPAGYGEVLDPSIYTEGGVRYLVYKLGDNEGARRFSILARPINTPSRTFKGPAITLLSEDQTEGINAEAPDILRAGQRTHLFVSRYGYETLEYSTQSWSAASILGVKHSTGKWVEGLGRDDEAEGLFGPGGAEVIEDEVTEGGEVIEELRIAFHSHHDETPNVIEEGRLAYTGTLDRRGDQFSLR
ncbi:family 43 glycosylhydrolase [Knoellia sp. S7-12]|uniref:family 43 glycosylhydrolase n=1 Tax=Knoellia sp. S7-12 TaxID=3126698 RepID=UPI0033677B3B